MTSDSKIDLTFFKQPTPAGCWIISESLQIYVAKRPTFLYRFFTRLLLGWEWRDF